jgi:hypothetical protein
MRDVGLDEIFEFATVYTLKGTKAPNVERLSKMRGVCREAKGDNTVLLAVVLEFNRVVALVTVKNKHPIDPLLPGFRIRIEMLNPL